MSPRPVTKRIRLPLSVSEGLEREARRRKWSISRIVARAIGRDLASATPRIAVFVTNSAGATLDTKVRVLSRLLAAYLLENGVAGGEAAADFRLEVVIQELRTELERKRQPDLARLRVNTTLCLSYQLTDGRSGAEVAGRNLAICRVTPPIVAGTAVGSDAIDRLLDEVADTVAVTAARSVRSR